MEGNEIHPADQKLTGDVELDVPTAESSGRDLVPGPAGEDGGEVGLGGPDVELGQAGPVLQSGEKTGLLVGRTGVRRGELLCLLHS